MIATSILLNGCSTLWTLLGVRGDPVARLTVIVTLLDPLLDKVASDWIVPVLTAGKAEGMAAGALHWPGLHMLHLHCIAAVWTRTPTKQPRTQNVRTGIISHVVVSPRTCCTEQSCW